MGTIRWGVGLVAVLAITVSWSGRAMAGPGPTKAQTCEAAKLSAAAKKGACLANERAKEVKGQTPNYAKCDDAFTKAFTRAETKAGTGVCPSENDAAAVEALIDGCFDELQAALSGSPSPPCGPRQFPASGQTTCWNSAGTVIACEATGQDGDGRAGGALSYTDNGDGTITDTNTGRMWEKQSLDGSIHDRDTLYTWDNAFAVHIAGLNAGDGFAGHTDWRLPNVKELQSIANYEKVSPSVSTAFNLGCAASCTVLTCSCTTADAYWSSSTMASIPGNAWFVYYTVGGVNGSGKGSRFRARAVRGGL